jgi:hypothetical protein
MLVRTARTLTSTAAPSRFRRVRRRTAAALAVLLLVGLLWRFVRYALAFPIWGDEAFVAVNFVVRDYAGLFRPLEYGQIVPLLFSWGELAVTRVLGYSEYALRLLPFVAGMVALLLFWYFCRRVLPPRPALLGVGFLAVSYYTVRHGAEVKPYATDLLVAVLLNVVAWEVYVRSRPERGTGVMPSADRPAWALNSLPRGAAGWPWWLALFVLAAAAPWASYPALFVLGGVGLLLTWLVVARRGAPVVLAGWTAFALVTGASAAAMVVTYAQPHAAAAARLTQIDMWTQAFPPLAEPWKLPQWLFGIHTGNFFAYPVGGRAPGSIATVALFVIGAVHLWRRNRPLLLTLVLTPFVLTFVAAALHKYPYGGSVRTSMYLAPAICLTAGLGLYRVLHWLAPMRFRWVPKMPAIVQSYDWRLTPAIYGICLLLVALAIGGVVQDVKEPQKNPEVRISRDAVMTLAARVRPGDQTIIFNATAPCGYAPAWQDWPGIGGQWVFDVLRFVPKPVAWAPPVDSVAAPAPGARTRLVVYHYDGHKAEFRDDLLKAYLAALEARCGPVQSVERILIKQKPNRLQPDKQQIERQEVYELGPAAPQ